MVLLIIGRYEAYMVKVGRIVIGELQTNCYFLYHEDNAEAIVIDPADKGEQIYRKLKEAGFEIKAILLTHGHFDHILGVNKLKELTRAQIYAHIDEEKLLQDTVMNLTSWAGQETIVSADHLLQDKEILNIAGFKMQVISTPGHTKGSCSFYLEEDHILVSGDTMFEASVGRSDFPTGNERQLMHSIKEILLKLPDETIVYPGHGEATCIRDEKIQNPYR